MSGYSRQNFRKLQSESNSIKLQILNVLKEMYFMPKTSIILTHFIVKINFLASQQNYLLIINRFSDFLNSYFLIIVQANLDF